MDFVREENVPTPPRYMSFMLALYRVFNAVGFDKKDEYPTATGQNH